MPPLRLASRKIVEGWWGFAVAEGVAGLWPGSDPGTGDGEGLATTGAITSRVDGVTLTLYWVSSIVDVAVGCR